MKVSEEELIKFVTEKIKLFVKENDIEQDVITAETRLIGTGSMFDSMDLVRFVVQLEEELNDELSIEIQLTDESAMSRRTSPFINATQLSKYILERVHGE